MFNKLSFPRFLALSTIKELPFYLPDDVEIVSANEYKTFFGYNKRFSEMQSRIYFQVKLNGYFEEEYNKPKEYPQTIDRDKLKSLIDYWRCIV